MERGGFAENAYIAIADHAASLRNSFIHTMKGGTAENCVVMFATGGAKLHNCHIFELGEGCEGTGLMGSCVTVKGSLRQSFTTGEFDFKKCDAWNARMAETWTRLSRIGCTPLEEHFGWCKGRLFFK